MKMVGTRAMQQKRRRHLILPNGTGYYKGEYIEGAESEASGIPHAFLIEQDPDTTILSHFHRQNQFQIIVGGGGSLGRHEVKPLLVHYAGAYTGYGPIVCGPEGVQYLTLRPRYDPGAQFMPEARERMVRGPKKHFSSEPIAVLGAEALHALKEVQCSALLPLEEDGLAASLYSIPPNTQAIGLGPATGAGQYSVVISGSLMHDGQSLETLENIYLTPDEAPLMLVAGEKGAQVLVLQFPPLAAEYRSPPQ